MKTVFITGATGGIGRAGALALARNGWNLVLHVRDTSAPLQRLVEELENAREQAEGSHGKSFEKSDAIAPVRVCHADLSDPGQVERLLAEIRQDVPRLDAFVHAAGLDLMSASIRERPFPERLHQLLQVDLVATVLLARELGKRMKRTGGGSVVLFGWNEIDYGIPGDTAQLYAAVKGGTVAFMHALAASLAPEVRVNTISPGWIKTRWGNEIVARAPEWDARARNASLAERWGTPEEVAATILHLLSGNVFLNKQNIRIDGGRR